jgi:hypothetical protein
LRHDKVKVRRKKVKEDWGSFYFLLLPYFPCVLGFKRA